MRVVPKLTAATQAAPAGKEMIYPPPTSAQTTELQTFFFRSLCDFIRIGA